MNLFTIMFQGLIKLLCLIEQNFKNAKSMRSSLKVGMLNFQIKLGLCPRGLLQLLPKTQDEDWDFFEKLA